MENEKLNEYDLKDLSFQLLKNIGISLAAIFFFVFLKRRISRENKKLTAKLNSILKDGKKWKVLVEPSPVPNAFCIATPTVFMTSRLVEMLSDDELVAVMLHEAGHINHKDMYLRMFPRTILLATLHHVINNSSLNNNSKPSIAFFIFFILNKSVGVFLNRTIGRLSEKRADDYAVKYGYADYLISSLKKLEKYSEKERAKFKCGKICKLIDQVGAAMDEHPPIEKRVQDILKSKETWEASQKMPMAKMAKYFQKKLGVEKQ